MLNPDGDDCADIAFGAASIIEALEEMDADARRRLQVFVVWRLATYARQPSVHILVVADRQSVYACSCTLLARRGLPCRHYFAYLLQHNIIARFCISAVHPRWLTTPQHELVHRFCTASSTSVPLPTAHQSSVDLTLRIHPSTGCSGGPGGGAAAAGDGLAIEAGHKEVSESMIRFIDMSHSSRALKQSHVPVLAKLKLVCTAQAPR
jgi:hypothetical protein